MSLLPDVSQFYVFAEGVRSATPRYRTSGHTSALTRSAIEAPEGEDRKLTNSACDQTNPKLRISPGVSLKTAHLA